MPRDSIFDHALVDDDRSFEEQMEDLGVEVVKPAPLEPEWYEPDMRRSNKVGLKDKISVRKTSVTIGNQAIEEMGVNEECRIKIGTAKYKELIVLALKPANNGLKITKSNKNSFRVGSKKLPEWLLTKGLKFGHYSLKKVKGGFIGIPEGGDIGAR